jgi:hypothetical protein
MRGFLRGGVERPWIGKRGGLAATPVYFRGEKEKEKRGLRK